MDELEAVVRDGEVWVRFQNFRKGSPDKDRRLMAEQPNNERPRLSSWLKLAYRLQGVVARSPVRERPGWRALALRVGSTLSFFFVVQVITGVFLWMSYSPSSQTAWESVYYIQHQMLGGWFCAACTILWRSR